MVDKKQECNYLSLLGRCLRIERLGDSGATAGGTGVRKYQRARRKRGNENETDILNFHESFTFSAISCWQLTAVGSERREMACI